MSAPVGEDELWSAVGDPTRRQMITLLLAEGTASATWLSERLPVTRQAVAKHLVVLDRVGLVYDVPVGRERRYQVVESQLSRAIAQLTAVGRQWDARLCGIKRIAEALENESDATAQQPDQPRTHRRRDPNDRDPSRSRN